MSKEYRWIYWEIQYFDPYTEVWNVLGTYSSEEAAMKKAPFYAHQKGEVRIVKHEEAKTVIGTMRVKREKANAMSANMEEGMNNG